MKNKLANIKTKLNMFIRNKAAGSKVKHFKTLQEMDTWIDKYGLALVHLGILRYDMFSPIVLSCIITPENVDETLSTYPCDKNLQDMLAELKKHHGKQCRDIADTGCFEGALTGVEVTQDDYYWILDNGQKKQFVTGVASLQFM